MSFFANLFGYVLKFLYDLVGNYGVAIILFSILVKVIMIPLTAKQQKTLKKNEKMQGEMKQLQFKYKNDPEKLNQEVMALYKREGMSPLSGCFSSIIQIILLFSVFLLVRSPLTYMQKMDTEAINKLSEIVVAQDSNANNAYKEIAIIQYVKNLEKGGSVEEETSDEQNVLENQNEEVTNEINANIVENSEDNKEEFDINKYKDQVNINMDFFGIDLSKVPTQSLNDWKAMIIPVLYVISSFISMKLTTSMTQKKKNEVKEEKPTEDKLTEVGEEGQKQEDYNPMGDASKTMTWMMPIMSVSIAIIAPLGLALYWLMNNVLMIVERLVFNKIYEEKEEEANQDA